MKSPYRRFLPRHCRVFPARFPPKPRLSILTDDERLSTVLKMCEIEPRLAEPLKECEYTRMSTAEIGTRCVNWGREILVADNTVHMHVIRNLDRPIDIADVAKTETEIRKMGEWYADRATEHLLHDATKAVDEELEYWADRIEEAAEQAIERWVQEFLGWARTQAPTPKRRDSPGSPTHSADFTSVDWFGTRHSFTKGNQAQAVRVLWEAWEPGRHSLTQETIGKRIDSAADRFDLAKTFRKRKHGGGYEQHLAWGTMIQQDSKGSYRLVPPEFS